MAEKDSFRYNRVDILLFKPQTAQLKSSGSGGGGSGGSTAERSLLLVSAPHDGSNSRG
jgi:hypothetical protein